MTKQEFYEKWRHFIEPQGSRPEFINDINKSLPYTLGVRMVSEMRLEQIEKHGFTIEWDQKHRTQGDLLQLAKYIIEANEDNMPSGFDPTFIKQIFFHHPDRNEQLAIAASLIAAEIDYRLKAYINPAELHATTF
jgi:hypothetical protein